MAAAGDGGESGRDCGYFVEMGIAFRDDDESGPLATMKVMEHRSI
jgi:hypothetical protein